MKTVKQYLLNERNNIIAHVKLRINKWHQWMRTAPQDYIEPGYDEPGIDVRLCVDRIGDRYEWMLREGEESYDSWHSDYYAATNVGLDANAEDLVDDLIKQI
jgi:hypothetical protein